MIAQRDLDLGIASTDRLDPTSLREPDRVVVGSEGCLTGRIDQFTCGQLGHNDDLSRVVPSTKVHICRINRDRRDLIERNRLVGKFAFGFRSRGGSLRRVRIGNRFESFDAERGDRTVLNRRCRTCRGHIQIGDQLRVGNIPNSHMTVGCTRSDASLGIDCQGIHGSIWNWKSPQDLGLLGNVLLELLSFFGLSLRGTLGLNGLDLRRHFSIDIVRPNFDKTLIVDCRGCRKVLSIGTDGHREDASRHRIELSNQVRIVADDTGGLSKHAIDLRRPIGTSDENLVTLGMSRKSLDTPSKSPWSNRGDVVDESFGFDFRKLDGHVASTGDQMLAIDGKDRRAGPVFVCALVEFLVSFEVESSNRVIGHT